MILFRSSASLWGCELKYRRVLLNDLLKGQPPCEAVSWNVDHMLLAYADYLSASLWGCELKYNCHPSIWSLHESASLWGCELKSLQGGPRLPRTLSASLWGCELKYCCLTFHGSSPQSASLWGCELKWLISLIQIQIHVSLLVRLWVEMITYCVARTSKAVSLLVRLWVEIISTT